MINKKYAELIISHESVGSTMTEAAKYLNSNTSVPEKFLIIANEQTNGTGRNGAVWQSPKGGLWFSYCFKTDSVQHQISLLIGLCLYNALIEAFPILEAILTIKWPNDLMIDGKKLAGILVQSQKSYIIAGIGLNTNTPMIELKNAIFQPISLQHLLGFRVSNPALVNRFLTHFNCDYKELKKSGISGFAEKINSRLFGFNKQISLQLDNQLVTGICKGIAHDGSLIILDNLGNPKYYYNGSITEIIT